MKPMDHRVFSKLISTSLHTGSARYQAGHAGYTAQTGCPGLPTTCLAVSFWVFRGDGQFGVDQEKPMAVGGFSGPEVLCSPRDGEHSQFATDFPVDSISLLR